MFLDMSLPCQRDTGHVSRHVLPRQARLAELSAVSDDALGQADEAKQQASCGCHRHYGHQCFCQRTVVIVMVMVVVVVVVMVVVMMMLVIGWMIFMDLTNEHDSTWSLIF